MNRTSIDWAQYSWNPITGCAKGCDYCYARRIAERFHGPDGFKPAFHEERLDEPSKITKPSRIFVGSMCDLFGDWVPEEWIMDVLLATERAPQHQYLFLTKDPQRYEQFIGMKPRANWWLGATYDTAVNSYAFRSHLKELHHYGWHTWASAEPLLDDLAPDMWWEDTIDWLVIGAMTGPGSKDRQPEAQWVYDLSSQALQHGIPLFQKQSLAHFWPDGKTIQEYPKTMTLEVAG